MAEYRLKPLKAVESSVGSWRIGHIDSIVHGEVILRRDRRGELEYALAIWSEVAIGSHSEGSREFVKVASLDEAVALVEAERLKAFVHDIDLIDAGANPAPNA